MGGWTHIHKKMWRGNVVSPVPPSFFPLTLTNSLTHHWTWLDAHLSPGHMAASCSPPRAASSTHSHFSPTCTPASWSPCPCRPPSSGTPALCGYRRCTPRSSHCWSPPWWHFLWPQPRPRCAASGAERAAGGCYCCYYSSLLTRWWQHCSRCGFVHFCPASDRKATRHPLRRNEPQADCGVVNKHYCTTPNTIKRTSHC